MTTWKLSLLMSLSIAAVACGPEVQFEETSASDIEESAATAATVQPSLDALSVVGGADEGPVDTSVQGRGEFGADLHDGRAGDLSAVIYAGEPMVVIELNVEQHGNYVDVSTGAGSIRVLRQRVSETEFVQYADAPGREYWLYNTNGYVCSATLADVWRVREEWSEPDEADSGYSDAPSRDMVAASILPVEGDCSSAQYATPARGSVSFFMEAAKSNSTLSAQAMSAFFQLPEYAEIQTDYLSQEWQPDVGGSLPPLREQWTQHTDSGTSVNQYTDESGRRLVRVAAWAGVGCGDFRGDLWAVWEQTDRGLLLRAASRGDAGAAFFLDRDGRLSFGADLALQSAAGRQWTQSFYPLEPWSCPC